MPERPETPAPKRGNGTTDGKGGEDGRVLHHGLYEVHLPVTDLVRSIEFYDRTLGFELSFGERTGSSALLFFTRGDVRWMLGLFEVEDVRHRHPAEHHVAFRVPGPAADRMIPFLRSRGVEPEHPSTAPEQGPMKEPIVHGWMPAASVFFRDPDGHLLELIAELDDAPRPRVAYMPLSEWRARWAEASG